MKNKALALVLVFVFGAPFASYWIYFRNYSIVADQEIWGQYGDYIGGLLNPLLGFVSILFLVYTINVQLKTKRESEFHQRLQLLQANIKQHYEFEFPGRVDFGQDDTAREAQISLRMAINNYYNETIVRHVERRNSQKINYNRIYIDEDSFHNEVRNLSKLFSLLESEIRRLVQDFGPDAQLEFYRSLYDGDVYILNAVIAALFDRGYSTAPVKWFEDDITFYKLHPQLFNAEARRKAKVDAARVASADPREASEMRLLEINSLVPMLEKAPQKLYAIEFSSEGLAAFKLEPVSLLRKCEPFRALDENTIVSIQAVDVDKGHLHQGDVSTIHGIMLDCRPRELFVIYWNQPDNLHPGITKYPEGIINVERSDL